MSMQISVQHFRYDDFTVMYKIFHALTYDFRRFIIIEAIVRGILFAVNIEKYLTQLFSPRTPVPISYNAYTTFDTLLILFYISQFDEAVNRRHKKCKIGRAHV